VAAEIVNLRHARKQKARIEKERLAQENRLQFGRTKAEKQLSKASTELERRRLDGAAIQPAKPSYDATDEDPA
jgi:Domain of unknown function (DUF4169)